MAKTLKERLDECITDDSHAVARDMARFIRDMAVFVRDGTPASGIVRIPHADRNLHYVLSTKRESYAVLKSSSRV
jgi:hypothetical protein